MTDEYSYFRELPLLDENELLALKNKVRDIYIKYKCRDITDNLSQNSICARRSLNFLADDQTKEEKMNEWHMLRYSFKKEQIRFSVNFKTTEDKTLAYFESTVPSYYKNMLLRCSGIYAVGVFFALITGNIMSGFVMMTGAWLFMCIVWTVLIKSGITNDSLNEKDAEKLQEEILRLLDSYISQSE